MKITLAVTPEEFAMTIEIMARMSGTTARIETIINDSQATNYVAKFSNGDKVYCRPTSQKASYQTFNGTTYQFGIFDVIQKVGC